MRPVLKVVLITLGVMAIVYGVYLLLGRPAIPIPSYRMQIGPENQLYPLVKATESDQMKLTLVTNGHVVASADDKDIAAIDYTPKTLQNAVDLAEKYMPPPDSQSTIERVTRNLSMPILKALYHTVRLKMTVIVSAN